MTVGFLDKLRAYIICGITDTLQVNGKKYREKDIEEKQFSEVSVFSSGIVIFLDRGLKNYEVWLTYSISQNLYVDGRKL